MTMRILCLDIGERRIGVATGDSGIGIATPLTTIQRRTWEQDCAELKRLLVAQQAERLIVGLPISLDGLLHQQGERIKEEGERLGTALGMAVVFWDERFSTVIAEERLQQSPTGGRRKTSLDAAAAAVILESYFASLSEARYSASSGGSKRIEP
jgi:putative Holliday junction resolvase